MQSYQEYPDCVVFNRNDFGQTGIGRKYILCKSIKAWQVRERSTMNESTIWRADDHSEASYKAALRVAMHLIQRGEYVQIYNFA